MALALLVRRRKEAVSFGLAHSLPITRIAERVQSHVATGIAESRILSRSAGIDALGTELEVVGVSLEDMGAISRAQIARDVRRANVFAKNYAEQWSRKAEGETVASAARAADSATLGSLTRTAVTESAEAFNDGRSKAAEEIPATRVELLKVWDAQLDKLTCPICSAADGTIVGIKESFPIGTPGAVHPWCRCTWQALTLTEHEGREALIEPKEPAKVISFPKAPQKPIAEPKPETAKPSKKALAEAEKAAAKDVKASLKASGVKATGDVRGTLKTMFGRVPSPEEINGAFGAEAMGKLGKFRGEAHFSYDAIQFRGGTSNGAISVSRKLAKSDGGVVARHEALFLSKSAQGQKVGAAILREQVSAYEKLGVDKITLNSAEVGRYYWPKIGFGAPSTVPNSKARFGKWLESQGLPAHVAEAPATMREIATLQIGDRKVGKEFLLSPDYPGNYLELDLKPGSQGLNIFKREIGE